MDTTPITPAPENPEAQPQLMSRMVGLLWVIVLALILAFCFFAGSFCITLLLGIFLAILVDPLISYLERKHIPRALSAALLITAGTCIFAWAGYAAYDRISDSLDNAPQYADKIRQLTQPLARKIQKVQEDAQKLTAEPQNTKKVTEVRVKEAPMSWPAYIVRGVGPVWGIVIVAGIVPFLMYFLLVRKEEMYERLTVTLAHTIDVPRFAGCLTRMVRAFALGNLAIGSVMAAITAIVLYALHVQGAVVFGILSGFLNLVPFIGVLLAAFLPLAAGLLQFNTPMPFVIIGVTVTVLHLISANVLIPKIIGSRVNIGPAAAIAGILFWGWLWGPIGVLLAIPLTAAVKLAADSHRSLIHLSNLLAESPKLVPTWIETGKHRLYRVVPYLRKRHPAS